jgi:outer membrane protein TolC
MLVGELSPLEAGNRPEAPYVRPPAEPLIRHLAQATTTPETRALTLKESIALALERNFEIIIEGFNPKIRAADVLNEQAEFDPAMVAGLRMSGGKEQVDDGPSRFPPDRARKDEVFTPVAGVERRLQAGTRLNLQLSHERIDSNEVSTNPLFATHFVDPSNEIRTTLSFTQPLLRNLGSDVNRTRIRIAQTNQEISETQLKERVIQVVSRVQQFYWELVFRIQELEVRRLSLKLAQDLLEQTKIQVTVGTLPQLSILEAEAGVATREEAVILAENDVRTVEDRLKELLGLLESGKGGEVSIIPTDLARFTLEEIDLGKSLEAAFEHRPDFLQSKLEIESRALNERFAQNQLFPTLDLQGRIALNGLDRHAGEAFDNFTSGDFVSYQVGVAFRYPLGNQAAKSRFTRARLEVEQAKALLQRVEQRITVEVREAVRNVETNIKRVSVTTGARELAQKKLEAEEKKLAVGLSTVREILRFQDDLSRAQSSEIRALTDYNISLANLDRARGTTLGRLDIIIGGR